MQPVLAKDGWMSAPDIARARELLGSEADGLTDAEVCERVTQARTVALGVIETFMEEAAPEDER